jgi:hypothetical protein
MSLDYFLPDRIGGELVKGLQSLYRSGELHRVGRMIRRFALLGVRASGSGIVSKRRAQLDRIRGTYNLHLFPGRLVFFCNF